MTSNFHGFGQWHEAVSQGAELMHEAWQDGKPPKGLHPHGEVCCSEHAAYREPVELLSLQPELLVKQTYA